MGRGVPQCTTAAAAAGAVTGSLPGPGRALIVRVMLMSDSDSGSTRRQTGPSCHWHRGTRAMTDSDSDVRRPGRLRPGPPAGPSGHPRPGPPA